MNLTQKEKLLLEDQKSHEELCIKKYKEYANQAQSPQLQQLFNYNAQQEEQHLNTINQLLSGQVPNVSSQSGGQQQNQNQGQQFTQQQQNQNQNQYQQQSFNQQQITSNQSDAFLCNDLLATEKYVSSTYDTSIFEMTNSQARQALNHIQKEEQQHGENIFNFMQANGMYKSQ